MIILAAAMSGLILCADPSITDGDTFRCDGNLKIRLWGIDAPELQTAAGPAARRALADLTAGQTLVCTRKSKSYDRIVAQCLIGNTDVAERMVRQGQAVDWPKFSRGYYSKFSKGSRR
ncbi:MAG: thermonuclease family protein [Phenylobacterium sp.]|uniref:thermonuclease family protein n=1 Tax=Phenylobacterium sp. TaxID=1871053 RepID=UPI002720A9E8|nr:thermonuclease family protein [Phenylobacterium sp.]MDO8912315.1 thermonuclease family protein [Phenylobacterium sp.]MDP3099527.1 thermonuclease family protein [Phenylobacterium sp.]